MIRFILLASMIFCFGCDNEHDVDVNKRPKPPWLVNAIREQESLKLRQQMAGCFVRKQVPVSYDVYDARLRMQKDYIMGIPSLMMDVAISHWAREHCE